MPDNGAYLLSNVGFSQDEKPLLLLQTNESFIDMYPIDQSFTLTFDVSHRFCIGWRDITTGERFACPTAQLIDIKYEQCSACQKRTGFNPAFYHVTTVSSQQEARNGEPHILYLAHFGSGVIKVGISHAKRGNARLLEQGARCAIILDTLPSAHIARQYEAQIAALPGIAETIQLRKKIELMTRAYDATLAKQELEASKAIIESHIGITFGSAKVLTFDSTYFPKELIDLRITHPTTSEHLLSGKGIGMLGSVLFCEQADNHFYLPIKKYVGYRLTLTDTVTPLVAPARQTSLF
jgi:hypothetical protein